MNVKSVGLRLLPTYQASAAMAGVLAILTFGRSASAAVATFDDLTEGYATHVLNDGGITFSNLVSTVGPTVFVVDRADGTLGGYPGFTSPNGVTANGYVPGPLASFGTFGSMTFSDGLPSNFASIEVYTFFSPGNEIKLQAFKLGTLVTSSSFVIPSSNSPVHNELSVSGSFDTLRMISSGPVDSGYSTLLFDTVTITPEPKSAGMAALTSIGILLRRKRRLLEN